MQRIFEISGKADVVTQEGTTEKKYSRDEDMVKRVLAVIAAISSNFPLSVLGDTNFRNYTASLDPRHKPPMSKRNTNVNRNWHLSLVTILVGTLGMSRLRGQI